MGRYGWIQDPATAHTKRFHRDEKSAPGDLRVFVDSGQPCPGRPPLLKTRVHLRHDVADTLWQVLVAVGWRPCEPQWRGELEV